MDGDGYIKKAYDSILRNDFEEAIDSFEQAINKEPLNASYHYKISITYARNNKLQKALKHAEFACSLDPSNEKYGFHREHIRSRLHVEDALVQMNHRNWEMAVYVLQEAVLADPLSVEAHLLLGISLAEQREYISALKMMDNVLKLNPEHEEALRLKTEYKRKISDFFSDSNHT